MRISAFIYIYIRKGICLSLGRYIPYEHKNTIMFSNDELKMAYEIQSFIENYIKNKKKPVTSNTNNLDE